MCSSFPSVDVSKWCRFSSIQGKRIENHACSSQVVTTVVNLHYDWIVVFLSNLIKSLCCYLSECSSSDFSPTYNDIPFRTHTSTHTGYSCLREWSPIWMNFSQTFFEPKPFLFFFITVNQTSYVDIFAASVQIFCWQIEPSTYLSAYCLLKWILYRSTFSEKPGLRGSR